MAFVDDVFSLHSKLAAIEPVVVAMACDERIVGTSFDDTPPFHNEDIVGVADGGQAMGNDEEGFFGSP